jgi:phosphatidylserine decarboxylase
MYSINILHWLYVSKIGKYLIQTKMGKWSESFLTSIIGKSTNTKLSTKFINSFIENNNLDMKLYQPVETYKTFNEFFSRQMINIDVNRPLGSHYFVSPADSLLNSYDTKTINDETKNIYVKGLDIKRILNNKDTTNHSLYIFYLSPSDYHRFYAPISGLIANIEHYGSFYDSVNPTALNSIPSILSNNSRVIITIKLDTPVETYAYFVIVGALLVGSIVLKDKINTGFNLSKGEEMGYFQFGGSTCILSFVNNFSLQNKDYVNRKVNVRQNIY